MKNGLLALLAFVLLPVATQAELPTWATYTATFSSTWSATTHPQDYPSNAHYSGLIGGVHDASVSFWAVGDLATTGMKQMAEWGSKTVLQEEVEAAIIAGASSAVISGGGLGTSPGSVSVTFDVSPDHPLATIVSMVAPSPDWFIGVTGLDLRNGDEWVDQIVVTLYPYDAGTDSGTTYKSGDVATNPAVPISSITGAPFTPGVPLGTLTFELQAASAVSVPAARLALSAAPNPFNPATELHYILPANVGSVHLAVYDVNGRLVRTLAPSRRAGAQSVRWDGVTDRGVRAASGVYFVRLLADGEVVVQKVALVQ